MCDENCRIFIALQEADRGSGSSPDIVTLITKVAQDSGWLVKVRFSTVFSNMACCL
jgi:hypothetical protein